MAPARRALSAMPKTSAHVVAVYLADALTVLSGANAGDALPSPADSVEGDYYRLSDDAQPVSIALEIEHSGTSAGRLAEGTDFGTAGAMVALEGQISLMAPDGDLVEVLVLSLQGGARVALPLSPLRPKQTYTLIGSDDAPGPIRLADVVAGAFARGTRIAMDDGRQVPVEEIEIGDKVVTRLHGAQPVRWKGAVQLRAVGGFAPVVVMPGVMGNPNPLTVSPYHRLFLYRRDAKAIAGASDLLVQARHLVDGASVLRREGGFVEYHSLVFDDHEVIYAEGVPSESLMVCPATLTRLPDAMAAPLQAAFPGLSQRLHPGTDVQPHIVSHLFDRPGHRPSATVAQ